MGNMPIRKSLFRHGERRGTVLVCATRISYVRPQVRLQGDEEIPFGIGYDLHCTTRRVRVLD